jgi:hypothetical protein
VPLKTLEQIPAKLSHFKSQPNWQFVFSLSILKRDEEMVAVEGLDHQGYSSTLLEYDQSYSLFLHSQIGAKCPRCVYLLLEHSGNGILWLVLASLVWGLPNIEDSSRCFAINFFLGLLVDLLLVGSLKTLIRRPRPKYNQSRDFVLVVAVDQYSFPSGHSARQAPTTLNC